MDPIQRLGNDTATTRQILDSLQARIWTALPGYIVSFNADAVTAVVQPTIQGTLLDKNEKATLVDLPLLHDCPVIFPSGGGFTLTFPIKGSDNPDEADECLVIFSSRCIDAWWQSGGIQPPAEFRMHDLSDGFVIVGPRSKARPLSNISATKTQLRTDDGTTFVEVGSNEITLKAATINIMGHIVHTGNQDSSGTITGTTDVVAGTKALKAHTHLEHGAGSQTSPPT